MMKKLFEEMYPETNRKNTVPETDENTDGVLKVTLTAEDSTNHVFHAGDEIRITVNAGRYYILDETNLMIPAEICMNLPMDEAEKLSLVDAGFTIKKVEGNVLKAEINNPYALVHHGQSEWTYLSK